MGLALFHMIRQKVVIALYDCEQIIEIVRNPSGKTAYGFHLLCLPELFFQLPPFRKIFDDAFSPSQFARFIVQSSPTNPNGNRFAILALPLDLSLHDPPSPERLVDQTRPVLRIMIDVIGQAHRQKFIFRGVTEHRHKGRIDI